MKTEVRKEFILEAYKSACSEWKSKIEKECPELFKNKSGWYKSNLCCGSLFFLIEHNNGSAKGYGFEVNIWREHFNEYYWSTINELQPATEEEVKEALIKEAKKRGFKEGVKYTSVGFYSKGSEHQLKFKLTYYIEDDMLTDGAGGSIYYKGKWAEIISNPIEEKINDLQKQLDELKKQL